MAHMLWRLTILAAPLISAFPFNNPLQARQADQCGGDDTLTPCGNGFPASFCCADGSRCVPVNSTGIVSTICCPIGRDCARVQAITCNITFQDVELFPASPIHTLNLTEKLPQCGDKCCPLGFDCTNNECVARNDKRSPATSSGRPATSTAGRPPSSSRPASSTPTTAPNGTTARPPQSQTSSPSLGFTPASSSAAPAPSFSGRSFAAGFIPGIVIGAALLFGIIFFLARRKRKQEEATEITSPPATATPPSARSAFGRRKNRRQISDPVVQPQYSNRTDFYHSPESQKASSPTDASGAIEKATAITQHSRKRSSSFYDTNTIGAPATPLTTTSENLRVASLFHHSPNKAGFPTTTTTITPMPPLPPLPPSSIPTPKGSTTPPHQLRAKKSHGSLRRQLSRFRKQQQQPAPDAYELRRHDSGRSKRRRVGSWSSGDDKSFEGSEKDSLDGAEGTGGGRGRESRGTIRVVMSPPHANMPPPTLPMARYEPPQRGGGGGQSGGTGLRDILPQGMGAGPGPGHGPATNYTANTGVPMQAYTLNAPPPVPQAGGGQQASGGLGSPYTPSKHPRRREGEDGGMLGVQADEQRRNRDTTFSGLMERAGLEPRRRTDGPLYPG